MIEPSNELKALALFSWSEHYPAGGLEDLIGFFDTIEDIHSYLKKP